MQDTIKSIVIVSLTLEGISGSISISIVVLADNFGSYLSYLLDLKKKQQHKMRVSVDGN